MLALTLLTVAVVVLVLVGYLAAIAWSLRRTARHVAALADGLEAVREHTRPLGDKLVTVNGALGALLGGLESADRHLARVAALVDRG
jgi:hypothetical protein